MSKFDSAFSSQRLSANQRSDRSCVGGVHKSLWNYLQNEGYDGPTSSLIAWALIKAASPKMNEHKEAYASLSARTSSQLAELAKVVNKCGKSSTTKNSAKRAELVENIGLVLLGLQGVAKPSKAPAMTSPSRVPAAPGASPDFKLIGSSVEEDVRMRMCTALARAGILGQDMVVALRNAGFECEDDDEYVPEEAPSGVNVRLGGELLDE